MTFSIIIPVYNRPREIRELLRSLSAQSAGGFEVIVVEDGSTLTSEKITLGFSGKLDVRYFEKDNEGPGPARNYGSQHANGEFFIYLDSDCVVHPEYIETLHTALMDNSIDAFGGPDRAAPGFSVVQKAVSYSMTSFFTTGGIRGGKNMQKEGRFFPRSFNMGFTREVFERTGGFSCMRFGEDIELSYRIYENGFRCVLIPEAYVYHKRRTNSTSFFKQVFYSGMARINLFMRYRDSLKFIHFLPAIFTVGTACCLALFFIHANPWFLSPLLLAALVWFFDSLRLNKNINVALLSIITSFIQLIGYGCGFIAGAWLRMVRGKTETECNKTKFF